MSKIINHKSNSTAVVKDNGFEVLLRMAKSSKMGDKRLEASCILELEGWNVILGPSQGFERSAGSRRVCPCQQNPYRTCLCLVGEEGTLQARSQQLLRR
jgi:hypothetical protein